MDMEKCKEIIANVSDTVLINNLIAAHERGTDDEAAVITFNIVYKEILSRMDGTRAKIAELKAKRDRILSDDYDNEDLKADLLEAISQQIQILEEG